MRIINLDKKIIINGNVEDLLMINIDDDINYIEEIEGIKTIGTIDVTGSVKTAEGVEEFEECFNVDFFSEYSYIEDRNKLEMIVDDFEYTIKDNILELRIKLKILGLKEVDKSFPAEEDSKLTKQKEMVEKIKKEISEPEIEIGELEDNDLFNYDDDLDIQVFDLREDFEEEQEEEQEEVKEPKVEKTLIRRIDKVEEVAKTSLITQVFGNKRIKEEVSWKLHVVRNEKTLEEIANKYQIDLEKLKKMNKIVDIEEGKLIFLPID